MTFISLLLVILTELLAFMLFHCKFLWHALGVICVADVVWTV